MRKTIPFWKMSGSGNDFVVIDNRRHIINGSAAKLAKRLCYRQEGVGADGLLLLSKVPGPTSKKRSKTPSFRMVYFNADGSRAGMCGNGARCMAWFARQQRVVGDRFIFETDAYPVSAHVQGKRVRITLLGGREYRPLVKARVGAKTIRAVFLNTGVPHAVVFVPNAKTVDVRGLGRRLRFHKAFGPKGANVNFVQKLGSHTLRVRTYERGVEDETLACGTGVTASAIAAVRAGLVKAPVRCVTSGGDTLAVNLEPQVTLEGPVRLTFKGEVHV